MDEARMLAGVHAALVGRRREAEVVVATLGAGRSLLLEGPPGTGKSTLLRSVAGAAGLGFHFVEGNADLTPARLVGHHDPSRVLTEDYRPDNFVEGPLPLAMRTGGLLYIEELNRVPEETLNVLITALAEGELHVPRVGKVSAAATFRVVAAMNPFDAVGTGRISPAIYDRTCRVAMGYQDADDEEEIVARHVGKAHPLTSRAVAATRASRAHADLRIGASVRGAIDTVMIGDRLAGLRREEGPSEATGLDAALAALTGKVTMREGSPRAVEEIVAELWREASRGKATRP